MLLYLFLCCILCFYYEILIITNSFLAWDFELQITYFVQKKWENTPCFNVKLDKPKTFSFQIFTSCGRRLDKCVIDRGRSTTRGIPRGKNRSIIYNRPTLGQGKEGQGGPLIRFEEIFQQVTPCSIPATRASVESRASSRAPGSRHLQSP